MPPEALNAPGMVGKFKGQPWTLFDTVVANSFLLGDTTNGKAKGSDSPALSAQGEMTFFQSAGRTRATMPWYTNLDNSGQLSYGLEVWQIYVHIMFPILPFSPSPNLNTEEVAVLDVAPSVRLAEAILNFGVLELELGQENQVAWPLSRFGAGGGLAVSGSGEVGAMSVNNSLPQSENVMKLPEPIEMPRTQNLNAKIRLASDVLGIIGTPAAPGVGSPLANYQFTTVIGADPPTDNTVVSLPMPPWAIQLGLQGRRIKDTQYGQGYRG